MVRGKPQVNKSQNGRKATSRGSTAAITAAASASAITSPGPSNVKPAAKNQTSLSVLSCCSCGIVISDDIKALQCDRCVSDEAWKCADCLNISSDLYDKLLTDPNLALRWLCDSCDKAVMDPHHNHPAPASNDKLDSLIALIDRLMHRYEEFETKIVDKCDTAEVLKLEQRISQLEERFAKWDNEADTRFISLEQKADTMAVDLSAAKHNSPTDEELVKAVVQEELSRKSEAEQDVEGRKNNIIVYKIPEKRTENLTERKTNNEIYVKDLLDAVFNVKLEEGDIEKMYRLGRWSEGSSRPLLIGFKDY